MKKALFSALFLVLLDLGTKLWALHTIPVVQGASYPFGGIGLFHHLGVSVSLNLVANTGMAWGLFPGHPIFLLIVRSCMIAALLSYLGFFQKKTILSLPFVLILAGAVGNVIDLICYRYVIDFIHFQFLGWSFPIFNIADCLITIGAFLFLFQPRSTILKTNQ